jgi:hypothetical protein
VVIAGEGKHTRTLHMHRYGGVLHVDLNSLRLLRLLSQTQKRIEQKQSGKQQSKISNHGGSWRSLHGAGAKSFQQSCRRLIVLLVGRYRKKFRE